MLTGDGITVGTIVALASPSVDVLDKPLIKPSARTDQPSVTDAPLASVTPVKPRVNSAEAVYIGVALVLDTNPIPSTPMASTNGHTARNKRDFMSSSPARAIPGVFVIGT